MEAHADHISALRQDLESARQRFLEAEKNVKLLQEQVSSLQTTAKKDLEQSASQRQSEIDSLKKQHAQQMSALRDEEKKKLDELKSTKQSELNSL